MNSEEWWKNRAWDVLFVSVYVQKKNQKHFEILLQSCTVLASLRAFLVSGTLCHTCYSCLPRPILTILLLTHRTDLPTALRRLSLVVTGLIKSGRRLFYAVSRSVIFHFKTPVVGFILMEEITTAWMQKITRATVRANHPAGPCSISYK